MNAPRYSLHSVRTRLALWNVGVLALVLVVLGIAFRLRMEYAGVAEIDRHLASGAQAFQGMIDHPPPHHPGEERPPNGSSPLAPNHGGTRGEGFSLPPPELGAGGRANSPFPGSGSHFGPGPHPHGPDLFSEYRPRLLFLVGQPMPGPPEERASEQGPPWDAKTAALSRQGSQIASTVQVGAESLRVLSFPLRREGKMVGVAQFAAPLGSLQGEVGRMTRTLLTLIPLALLVAGLGGAFLTDRALRPVREVTQAAGRIEAENLSGRLPVTGSDEFAALAHTFNAMLGRLEKSFDRLEQAYEQQRRFTADASHELRTPLTTIKANTSLALLTGGTAEDYRRALLNADAAADRTTRLVQDLLLLARADAGEQTQRREPVSLAPLLAQAAESVLGPKQAGIRLCLPDWLPCLEGDGDALRRLFTNLLENAARHTPPGGAVTVSASVESQAVTVSVTDTGDGIAPQHLPHLFERFYRVDAARSGGRGGTGLGLAICRSIADAHGGTITLESAVGMGTTVRVRLPVG